MRRLMIRVWICWPLLTASVVWLGSGSLAHAEETVATEPVAPACDDNEVRDRSRGTRRRPGGSNRDCEYREIVVDAVSGEVVEQAPAPPRAVVPRRYSAVQRPTAEQYVEAVPIPDRWRIVDSLGYQDNWYDPYHQNTIKGDKPLHDDWFFNFSAISDSVVEIREVATPVGQQTTGQAGANDVLGGTEQAQFNQNLALEFVYYQGDTVFKPPNWEFRFTPVLNYNYTEIDEQLGLNANPDEGEDRQDQHLGIQAAFVDKHLRDVSSNYDFDSVRVGIQPFSSDFRGFLFQDSPFGVRLFGTRHSNRLQYNLAWFRRMEKDTNSGLNDVSQSLRDDDLFIANVYFQDFPGTGFVSQLSVIHDRNREAQVYYDDNDFIARPASIGTELGREYDVTYLGYSGDGHIGRLNITASAYVAVGEETPSVFTDDNADIEAGFFAIEPSMDFDWLRVRLSFLYGSGDDDPFDDEATGFDAIFENPQFAGADSSYWIRQAVPLIGGGRVALSSRNGVLNSLRSSKEHGQSNFTNPGIWLFGGGVDFDLLPELRLSLNANYLSFDNTATLEVARAQADIDKEIGLDLSTSLIWRPLMTQNMVLRLSFAQLQTGQGLQELYEKEDPYSLLFNLVLTF